MTVEDQVNPLALGTALSLPYPQVLPVDEREWARAVEPWRQRDVLAMLADPQGREELRAQLFGEPIDPLTTAPADQGWTLISPAGRHALDEQAEHDRYFRVRRTLDEPAQEFLRGLLAALLLTIDDAEAGGLTIVDSQHWAALFSGAVTLFGGQAPPAPPQQWQQGYDPARRWLIGHQVFFVLIQGVIVGLHQFSVNQNRAGLTLAAAFLRSSSATMRYASDFSLDDYEKSIRPDMAPPTVRAGFSGFQTRDHAYLVRVMTTLRKQFATARGLELEELVDALTEAYSAHEFICGRFRGTIIPSLRMQARGTQKGRSGVDVVRDLMRKRLALIDPDD